MRTLAFLTIPSGLLGIIGWEIPSPKWHVLLAVIGAILGLIGGIALSIRHNELDYEKAVADADEAAEAGCEDE